MSITIRFGRPDERAALEELQRRASLMWEEYLAYLLANPDVIELPLAQLREGRVRVAQWHGRVAGFAALLVGSALLSGAEAWRRQEPTKPTPRSAASPHQAPNRPTAFLLPTSTHHPL